MLVVIWPSIEHSISFDGQRSTLLGERWVRMSVQSRVSCGTWFGLATLLPLGLPSGVVLLVIRSIRWYNTWSPDGHDQHTFQTILLLCVLPRLPGAPITKRRVQHKPHECLNPTSVSKQRCRDSCGLSSSFVGARYGKNRITRHTKRQLKLGTRRQKWNWKSLLPHFVWNVCGWLPIPGSGSQSTLNVYLTIQSHLEVWSWGRHYNSNWDFHVLVSRPRGTCCLGSYEFKFRVSTYNIRALTYNIKEFLWVVGALVL